ncbi:MAG TPA: ABC transporter substrate-binding protein [Candidatus Binatia bacterium]|jgi:NitT/TauT family transport system substrate-binding protein|nr:ABC transporter substrate-binding protein [Candidatus Binatia bacterium]
MSKNFTVIFTLFSLLIAGRPSSAQLKKIHFSTTSIAVTELQFRIAQMKGFYREEGLDLETLLIRGSVGMQALIGGSVDYASAAGSIIAAGVRGAPVKLVLIVNSKPQFDLVGQRDIKSVEQLKSKVVGISSRGGAVDLLTQLILTQHGLTPNKDVTSIVIGTPEELATALRTGRIAACLLSPPRQLLLYREGFSKLAYSGDYLASYPSGGVGATDEKIRTNPTEVLAFVRASLKGLQYYSQHRTESIDIISKYLGVKDLTLAGEVYDLHLSRLGGLSYLEDSWMRGAIDFTKKSLAVTKEIPPSQVFDFSFVERALGRRKN